jgi:hypothetical protein
MSYSWKHKINMKSSTEAEIVGVDDSLGYILWARYFMIEQGDTTWTHHCCTRII